MKNKSGVARVGEGDNVKLYTIGLSTVKGERFREFSIGKEFLDDF